MSAVDVDVERYAEERARAAKEASRALASLSGEVRNGALRTLAGLLRRRAGEILDANAGDVAAAPGFGLTDAQIDRLRLTPQRLEEMAVAVEEVVALPDPLGRVLDGWVRPNGLEIRRISVPLGVVFFIYESRPNVTTDAAAICLKSGNAVILRGGKEAQRSNRAIGEAIRSALVEHGVPADAAVVVDSPDRRIVGELLKQSGSIDLAIPRGGVDLIQRVAREAAMPVLKHYLGVCHVYVHEKADLAKAVSIVENAKCQRPSVCNAAECLLIDAVRADDFLPPIARRLIERGVELRGCSLTCKLVPEAVPARAEDYDREFGSLILAVRIVSGIDEAIAHIARHGSGHTDAVVTEDLAAARKFVEEVDSSAVMVNASTRFNDGGQFGLGAEIGISTDKFHARGPCGLAAMTSYKYVVVGDGHIRL
jgi:glutamate-5-semialdehyde dehydrogenase